MEYPPPYSEDLSPPQYSQAATATISGALSTRKLRCELVHCEPQLTGCGPGYVVSPGKELGRLISYIDVHSYASLAQIRWLLLDRSLHAIPSIKDSHGEVLYWLHLRSEGLQALDISRLGDGTGLVAKRLASSETQGLRLTVTLVGEGDMALARRQRSVCVVQ